MKQKCKPSEGAMDGASQTFGSVSLFWKKKIITTGGGRANGCGPGPRQETAMSSAIFVINW